MVNIFQFPNTLRLLVLTFAIFSHQNGAIAIQVWQTTGDQQDLLRYKGQLSFAPGVGSGGIRLNVSPANMYQSVEGFGAAMTDSSAWLIDQKMNASQRDQLMRALFSTLDGIGLNYVRVPMGASDFTASGFYTYNDLTPGQTDPAQNQFSISHDQAYIIPALLQAKGINDQLKLMASPWSAPAWMKTNGSLFGGSLQQQWYGSYAIYFERFLNAYEAAGLPIAAVSLQNEPAFNPGDYPAMLMSAHEQLDLIRNHIGPTFAAANIDTKILIYDHNWDNINFADTILSDPIARDYVAGTAFHGYAGSVAAQSDLHALHPDKGIYFTEITGGDFAPNFADNLVWGTRNIIIGNLRNWGRTALYWNLALDENSGPHLNGCDDCRGVVTIDSGTGNFEFNEEYYTLAHASKFIQQGARRIDSDSLDNVVETVAFQNPSGSRVLVALNPSQITRTIRIVENGQHASYSMPAQSVATFVWAKKTGDFNDDGVVDDQDIDFYAGPLRQPVSDNTVELDLNSDGQINSTDRMLHVTTLVETSNGGIGALVGDVNLDGTVNVLGDAFTLVSNVNSPGPLGWGDGDLTGDGIVTVLRDAFQLVRNLGQSNSSPE
jgi:glucosylceramidase